MKNHQKTHFENSGIPAKAVATFQVPLSLHSKKAAVSQAGAGKASLERFAPFTSLMRLRCKLALQKKGLRQKSGKVPFHKSGGFDRPFYYFTISASAAFIPLD